MAVRYAVDTVVLPSPTNSRPKDELLLPTVIAAAIVVAVSGLAAIVTLAQSTETRILVFARGAETP